MTEQQSRCTPLNRCAFDETPGSRGSAKMPFFSHHFVDDSYICEASGKRSGFGTHVIARRLQGGETGAGPADESEDEIPGVVFTLRFKTSFLLREMNWPCWICAQTRFRLTCWLPRVLSDSARRKEIREDGPPLVHKCTVAPGALSRRAIPNRRRN